MLAQQTIDQLRQLNLTAMIDALRQQREQPVTQELAFEERLALLLEREILHRENRRLDRLLKAARLRVHACIEDIDYRHPRGLEKPRIAALAQLDWVRQAHNLCLTGPTGCAREPSQLQSRLPRQIVQFVAGAAPARIRFSQHATRKQVVDVAQCRIRRALGDGRPLAAGELAFEPVEQLVQQLHLPLV